MRVSIQRMGLYQDPVAALAIDIMDRSKQLDKARPRYRVNVKSRKAVRAQYVHSNSFHWRSEVSGVSL